MNLSLESRARLRLFILWLSLASPLPAATSPGVPGEEVRVVCRAIELRETPWDEGPDLSFPVSLVVLGKVSPAKDNRDGQGYEMQVDKLIYGSIPSNHFLFSSYRDVKETQPAIATFSAAEGWSKGFHLKQLFPTDEAKAELALSQARLDFKVLSARSVFTGTEQRAVSGQLRKIKVGRVFYGSLPAVGDVVLAHFPGDDDFGLAQPRPLDEEMIYLVRSVQPGKKSIPPVPDEYANETIYTLIRVFRLDQAEQVQNALNRRSSYPITIKDEAGKRIPTQEITFRGSTADAIELLGSMDPAAVALGEDTLKSASNAVAATSALVSRIQKDMLQFASGQEHTYRLLRNSIPTLSQLAGGKADGEIGKLVRRFMSFLRSSEGDRAMPPRRDPADTYWNDEEEHTDTNHSLAWLLMALDGEEINRYLAADLLSLRGKLRPGWKSEVQLALDAAEVEDSLQLSKARGAEKDSSSLFIGPSCPATGDGIAFSHDSRFLACGEAVWNVSDWSKAGKFACEGSIDRILFSPDDRFLFVFGAGFPIQQRVDWRSGKVVQSFEGHKAGLCYAALAPDGLKMVTASYDENIIHVWEVSSGKIVRSFEMPAHCYHLALSPDGKLLVRQTSETWLSIDFLAGGVLRTLGLPADELLGLEFSADGAYLVVSQWGFGKRASEVLVRLIVYDVKQDFAILANKTFPASRGENLAISPDSKYVVFRESRGPAWAASLPDLATFKPLISGEADGSSRGIAFSPDGKLLAFASRYDSIHLFDAKTLEPIQAAAGHARHVSSVHFSPDGKILRSVGTDNVASSWSTRTGKPEGRCALPQQTVCISVHPDGRYALCTPAAGLDPAILERTKLIHSVKVLDLQDGKIVSEVALPGNRWSRTPKILWLKEPEALCPGENTLRRFNYLTGFARDYDYSKIYGDVSEDGQSIYLIEGGLKERRLKVERFSIETGELTPLGEAELPSMTGNLRGLVPNSNLFYLASPGLYIFDRAPVKPVAKKRFKGWSLSKLCFSRDGSMYAVAGGHDQIQVSTAKPYQPSNALVRVVRTLAGDALLAFPAHSQMVKDLQFSPDGKQLAIVSDDGFIELRTLNLARSQ